MTRFGWRPLLFAIAATLAGAFSLACALLLADRVILAEQRQVLLAETAAAARALQREDGTDVLTRLLPGRWARSSVVRHGPDEPQISGVEGDLVGRAPVRAAGTGEVVGTVAVVERRGGPRRLPRDAVDVAASAGLVLLVVSLVGSVGFEGPRRWVLCTFAFLAFAASLLSTWHWAHGSLVRLHEQRRQLSAALEQTGAASGRTDVTSIGGGIAVSGAAGVLAWLSLLTLGTRAPGPRADSR